MEKLPEFMLNHPYLFAALAAVIVFIIVTELRRKGGARAVSAREAVQLINQDAAVVDIREQADYKSGHILHAKHIPLARLAEETGRISADKNKPVLVYCKTGMASPGACARLKAEGYQQAFYLKGGIYGWLDENLPLEK